MELKETKLSEDGVFFKKAVEEVPSKPSKNKKDFIRLDIQNKVFDNADSLADTTKWVSLLTSMISDIYKVLPEEQKSLIPTDRRQVIEYALDKFSNTTTRGDIQIQNEGTGAIDKILDRQARIAEIVK